MRKKYIDVAYNEAKKAKNKNEVPVGCVIVKNNEIISKGYNKKESKNNSIMHAEIIAINKACKKLKTWRLDNCEIYITLEPCMMCMGAIMESRIKKVYYGVKSNYEHMYDNNIDACNVKIIDLNNKKCSEILSDFFKNKRKK